MGFLVYPCCCCCCYFKAAVRCLHWAALYSQSIAIEERPMGRLHWSAYSSQRECVWQLTRFGGRKWRSGVNRISHPDWLKLSVELNCAPNQNTKFFPSLQLNSCILFLKFAQVMNVSLLIRRELFYIVWHEEILNHNTFPLLQVSKLCSSFFNNCSREF